MIFITLSLSFFFLHTTLFAQNHDQVITSDPETDNLEWLPCPEFMPESCRISVLQGDPARPNADIFFRLASNTTAPEHTHTSPERMVMVSGELQVNYEGYEPDILKPGTYAYGPAELPHSAQCISNEDCIFFIAFEDPVDAFEE